MYVDNNLMNINSRAIIQFTFLQWFKQSRCFWFTWVHFSVYILTRIQQPSSWDYHIVSLANMSDCISKISYIVHFSLILIKTKTWLKFVSCYHTDHAKWHGYNHPRKYSKLGRNCGCFIRFTDDSYLPLCLCQGMAMFWEVSQKKICHLWRASKLIRQRDTSWESNMVVIFALDRGGTTWECGKSADWMTSFKVKEKNTTFYLHHIPLNGQNIYIYIYEFADAFILSNLHCIQAIIFSQFISYLGNRTSQVMYVTRFSERGTRCYIMPWRYG